MAINKKLLHFKKFSDFNSKKLSANEANTQYTLGVDGAVTTGSPDVLYQSICWIKDTQQQWTHGQLYDCSASEGGEENVQSDWNVTDTSSDAYIKNKPTIPAEQVNADWNATSGKAQILNKPTIPAAVTVDTALSTTSTNPVQNKAVATGINAKYTKPSAGIPKSDLAAAVQTSLGKADTALQTEQYKGTVTGVKINGTTNNPDANGLVDLGEISGGGESVQEVYVIDVNGEASEVYAGLKAAWDAGVKVYYVDFMGQTAPVMLYPTDDNAHTFVLMYSLITTEEMDAAINSAIAAMSIFQITAESITMLGSGQIPIGGSSGGSSGGSGAYAEVSHGTNDTTFELTPNTFHVWDEVASLTLTLGAETSGVANEYLFQFLSGSTPTTLSLPDDLKWPDDDDLVIEANKMYQLSILKGAVSVLSWSNAPTLVDNLVSVEVSNNKYLISLQYPAASDLTVKVRDSDGATSANIPIGTSSATVTPMGPFADTGAYIESIDPEMDNTYFYII